MKKVLAMLLVLSFALSLAACGSEPIVNNRVNVSKTESEAEESDSKVDEPDSKVDEPESKVDEPESKVDEPESKVDEPESKVEEPKAEVEVDETVVVDENDVKITVKSVKLDRDSYSPKGEVKVLVENNSSKTLSFSVKDFAVNDCMVSEYSSIKVAAGKKANESLSFYLEDLEIYNIDVIEKIDFYFHIYDSDSYDNYMDTETITIENTAAEGSFAFDESGTVIYDDNGIKMICKGVKEATEYSGPSVVMYVINNTGKAISVNLKDVSINGFMIGSSFYCNLPDGKSMVEDLIFNRDDLVTNEISTIEETEFYISTREINSWDALFESDIIKLTF